MAARNAPWTAPELALAARLWRGGRLSAAQIAARVSAAFGVRRTAAAVVRQAANLRDDFGGRGRGFHAAGLRAGRDGDPGYAPPPPNCDPADAAAYDAASRRVGLEELGNGDCRFPVDDPAPGGRHLFCGAATARGRYCCHHARRASGGWCAEAA